MEKTANWDTEVFLQEQTRQALAAGASDAAIIDPGDIVVEDRLARMCLEPRCPNYGLSPGCPPHVAGPEGLRQWLKACRHVLVVKIDVPAEIMMSFARREIYQLLHEIVATAEQAAIEAGFTSSRGLAGGSCKNIFCHHKPDCRVLNKQGECRNPHLARPSMSGFGVNVAELMAAAGWPFQPLNGDKPPDGESMGTACGIVLIA